MMIATNRMKARYSKARWCHMATNENEIGVRARFIMEDFDRHVQQYNAKLAQANQATNTFYQEQTKQQEKAVQTSKVTAEKQSQSINQVVTNFRQAAFFWPVSLPVSSLTTRNWTMPRTHWATLKLSTQFDALDTSVSALGATLCLHQN